MRRLATWLYLVAVVATAATISVKRPATLSAYQPPLIIWHGLGDSYDADGLKSVADLAQKINPGTVVYTIRLGEDGSSDRQASFFGNLTEQLMDVCTDLASHPHLAQARRVNAMGFSQGGQFLRAFVERCNVPPVKSLVTIGSQHNGISKFQDCGPTDWVCKGAAALLSGNTLWSDYVQSRLVPAQYFRDPEDLEHYLEKSNFLADINNERKDKSSVYRENLAKLHKFVMYVFEDDTTVIPKESGWFAEVNATTGVITPLQFRKIYTEDWLGLKELDERNALVFKTTPGRHMELDESMMEGIFKSYFGPEDHTASEAVKVMEDL